MKPDKKSDFCEKLMICLKKLAQENKKDLESSLMGFTLINIMSVAWVFPLKHKRYVYLIIRYFLYVSLTVIAFYLSAKFLKVSKIPFMRWLYM